MANEWVQLIERANLIDVIERVIDRLEDWLEHPDQPFDERLVLTAEMLYHSIMLAKIDKQLHAHEWADQSAMQKWVDSQYEKDQG